MAAILALRLRKFSLSPLRAIKVLLGLRDFARSKQHLTRLDRDLLRDTGLSEAEVEEILAQSIWDAPAHWRR